MGQNFHRFLGLPNIRENYICELGILAVLSRDSGQHPRKFYPRIFIFGAIRENFVPRNFPAIQYVYVLYAYTVHTYVPCTLYNYIPSTYVPCSLYIYTVHAYIQYKCMYHSYYTYSTYVFTVHTIHTVHTYAL